MLCSLLSQILYLMRSILPHLFHTLRARQNCQIPRCFLLSWIASNPTSGRQAGSISTKTNIHLGLYCSDTEYDFCNGSNLGIKFWECDGKLLWKRKMGQGALLIIISKHLALKLKFVVAIRQLKGTKPQRIIRKEGQSALSATNIRTHLKGAPNISQCPESNPVQKQYIEDRKKFVLFEW